MLDRARISFERNMPYAPYVSWEAENLLNYTWFVITRGSHISPVNQPYLFQGPRRQTVAASQRTSYGGHLGSGIQRELSREIGAQAW